MRQKQDCTNGFQQKTSKPKIPLIIHGKGIEQPSKLKKLVPSWLGQTPWVTTYRSCPPKLGGREQL